MLSAAEQLEHIEDLIVQTGGRVLRSTALLDPADLDTKGRLGMAVEYRSGHHLHVTATIDVTPGYPVWVNYAFHLVDPVGAPVFRYDNAPHYPEMETFPHHKHVGPNETPEEALPTFRAILVDIVRAVYP